MQKHVNQILLIVMIVAAPYWADSGRIAATPVSNIADLWYAVHDAGRQRIGLNNAGVFVDPTAPDSVLMPRLEYPAGSGTIFLRGSGIWIGGIRRGERIVSVTWDTGGNTSEYGQLEFGTPEDLVSLTYGSIGWVEKRTTVGTARDQENARRQGRYLGIGRMGIDDDGDGLIDEDPAGDISRDYIDNDGDGLFDDADPDFDGDAVVGSLDDDADGLQDEDDLAVAGQELITAYVDTCQSCLHSIEPDGFTPLGILVKQHTYQWGSNYDFVLVDIGITSIVQDTLHGLCGGMLFDFEIGDPSNPRDSLLAR